MVKARGPAAVVVGALIGAGCGLLPSLASPALAQPAANAGCLAIRQACRQAGFQPGAGVQQQCFQPIVNGTAQPAGATQALPTVSAALVAECRNERGSPHATGSSAAAGGWPRGVYVFREELTNEAQFRQALATPGVDGMAMVLDWSTLQPTQGSFVTATIDSQITDAKAHSLPVELVIRAGASTPSWVAPGQRLPLAYAIHGGSVGRCQAVDMPPPWNAAFRQAFAAVLQRTVDYVRQQGVTIAVVKLTGINATSEELRLPAEPANETANCSGGGVNDIAIWKGAGYTPSRVEQAMHELATTFAQTLPSTPVTIALITGGGFPPIDESGQIVTGSDRGALNTSTVAALVDRAAGPLQGHLILQEDFLGYDQAANATVVGLARTNGAPVAWQTNLWRGNLGQGAGCGGSADNATACTNAQYLALLEEGIKPAGGSGPSAQGLYIEVFPYDAITYPQAIAQAHAELVGQ